MNRPWRRIILAFMLFLVPLALGLGGIGGPSVAAQAPPPIVPPTMFPGTIVVVNSTGRAAIVRLECPPNPPVTYPLRRGAALAHRPERPAARCLVTVTIANISTEVEVRPGDTVTIVPRPAGGFELRVTTTGIGALSSVPPIPPLPPIRLPPLPFP